MPLHFSDAELLRGLVSCNETILRAYYKTYYRSIRRYILSNHGNGEDARDVFQEVLMVLLRKVQDNSLELTCALGTYIYAVSKILWLKELHKRKRITDLKDGGEDCIDDEMDIIRIAEENERLLIYRTYFEKLSEKCRQVLTLFLEGRSITEITAIMGYKSEQHTKNRRYRCKLSLINSIRHVYGVETKDSHGNDEDH